MTYAEFTAPPQYPSGQNPHVCPGCGAETTLAVGRKPNQPADVFTVGKCRCDFAFFDNAWRFMVGGITRNP
jgi:hypothetical protein